LAREGEEEQGGGRGAMGIHGEEAAEEAEKGEAEGRGGAESGHADGIVGLPRGAETGAAAAGRAVGMAASPLAINPFTNASCCVIILLSARSSVSSLC